MEEIIKAYNENLIKRHGLQDIPKDWSPMIKKISEVLGPVNLGGNSLVPLDPGMEKGEKVVRFILDSWISERHGRYWRKELYRVTKSQPAHGYFNVEEYKLHILGKEEFLQSLSGSEAYQFASDIDKLFESPEYKLLRSLDNLKATYIW